MLQIVVSLLTLTVLEIVLGFDNLVFITILSQHVKPNQQALARRLGLLCAVITRLLLLAVATWLIGRTQPLFVLYGQIFSARTLLLLSGGLFLLVKGIQEIHATFIENQKISTNSYAAKLGTIIVQIALFDIIFSLDSIFTAVSLTTDFWIMAVAIILAIMVMLFASETLSRILQRYPTLRVLALSFLLLLGVVLMADAFGYSIPRGYIYFAIVFALVVETLKILLEKRQQAIK